MIVVVNRGIHGFVFVEGGNFLTLTVQEIVLIGFKAAVVFNLDSATEENVAQLIALLTVGAVELETRFFGESVHVVECLSVSAARHVVELLLVENFVLQNFFVYHCYQALCGLNFSFCNLYVGQRILLHILKKNFLPSKKLFRR